MEGDIEEGWHNGYDLTDSLESAKIGVKFGAQFTHTAPHIFRGSLHGMNAKEEVGEPCRL